MVFMYGKWRLFSKWNKLGEFVCFWKNQISSVSKVIFWHGMITHSWYLHYSVCIWLSCHKGSIVSLKWNLSQYSVFSRSKEILTLRFIPHRIMNNITLLPTLVQYSFLRLQFIVFMAWLFPVYYQQITVRWICPLFVPDIEGYILWKTVFTMI